jgi:hypothetical protein
METGATPVLRRLAIISSQREPPLHFIRRVRKHPVVKSRPLGIARIQFLIGQFARVSFWKDIWRRVFSGIPNLVQIFWGAKVASHQTL